MCHDHYTCTPLVDTYITCLHHMLTSHAYITCLHHMLTSHAYITCLHHMLTSHAYITCLRHMLTSHAYITCLHRMLTSHAYIRCLHHMTSRDICYRLTQGIVEALIVNAALIGMAPKALLNRAVGCDQGGNRGNINNDVMSPRYQKKKRRSASFSG